MMIRMRGWISGEAAGNPVSGVIAVEDGTVFVVFTDSGWEYI